MVNQATCVAQTNPEQAQQLLETARRMTRSLGALQDKLRKTCKISSDYSQNPQMGDGGTEGLSEEQIRKLSGT